VRRKFEVRPDEAPRRRPDPPGRAREWHSDHSRQHLANERGQLRLPVAREMGLRDPPRGLRVDLDGDDGDPGVLDLTGQWRKTAVSDVSKRFATLRYDPPSTRASSIAAFSDARRRCSTATSGSPPGAVPVLSANPLGIFPGSVPAQVLTVMRKPQCSQGLRWNL
jgi:hypothetical protein